MRKLTRYTQVGTEFSGRTKSLDEARVLAFSGGRWAGKGWPQSNIHTDTEFAKNVGLPSRAVSATQYMGYLVELMIEIFGESWLNHGRMDVKFIRVVDVGAKLVAKAVVTTKEQQENTVKFTLDIWCEDENNNKVAVGTATGLVL